MFKFKDVNLAVERVSQQVLGVGIGSVNSNSVAGDDKRNMAPQSNSQMNPLSVTNPQSVFNPMSVNTPNSVKSISDEKIASNQIGDSGDVSNSNGNPLDFYNNAINNFLNTCDDIEKNLACLFINIITFPIWF